MIQTTLPLKTLTKITTVFLFIAIICLGGTSCQSSKSGNKRSSSRSQAYYSPSKRKAKSGNKRSNHQTRTVTSSKKSSGKRGKSYSKDKSASTYTKTSNKWTAVSASAQAAQVIKAARSYSGTPYRYGGTTRKGMDCSGLLCTSFASIDMQLPRTSQEQSGIGRAVNLRNIEPGDLVFFSDKRSASRITHVGMVTEVNGNDEIMFIHSSTSRGVREDNLYSDYFKRIFVKAVRPF